MIALANRLAGSDNGRRRERAQVGPSLNGSLRGHVRALTFINFSLVCLAATAPAVARKTTVEEVVDRRPSQNHSNDVIIILNWDGKAISGTINPGSDRITIKHGTQSRRLGRTSGATPRTSREKRSHASSMAD
jgi:hypothetical protein